MDLESLRREYLRDGLTRETLADHPIDQFQTWMSQVLEMGLSDPTAMTVATVDATGQPSQRVVLLKHVDETGFVFYTNYESRKSEELDGNPKISLHFPWHAVERQVKVCGQAEKISTAESLRYFASRPRGSQVAAFASPQSKVLTSRGFLLNEFERIKQKFKDGEIPLPSNWGGYRVVPTEVEFWQGGENRLHDRFRYLLSEGNWQIDRLAP